MASYTTGGQLANYNSLTDKNLSGYFANTKMRKHLVRSGLITKNGEITSENSYRLKIAKREHREHVKDLLATAIVEKALDMERMRQYEIRKKLDELYKIELVNKVRSERGGKSKEELYALLSPRSGGTRRKHRRNVKSAAVTSSEKEMTKLPEINFDERTKILKYESTSVDSGSESASRYTIRPPKQPSAGRSVSAHAYGKAPHPPPPKSKRKKKRKVHRGLMLAKSEQMVAHRVQVQSMAEVTMKFLGSNLHLANDMFPANKLSEIQVIQQHCGASTVCLFREMIPPNTVFTFVSRRHRGSPFGLTINIDGIKNIRISSCCEYKHKPGYRLGGKNSQFGLISVQGAAPCYRCQVRLNLLDKNNNEAEKEASSDEEAATRSFDIIVSRGGKRQEAVKERPISANVTTQTESSHFQPILPEENDQTSKEQDTVAVADQYQDDFDDDAESEADSKNGDDLNENVSSSSESDSSDNEDKDSESENSDSESDSENNETKDSEEQQMNSNLTETDDTITSTNHLEEQDNSSSDTEKPSSDIIDDHSDAESDVVKKSESEESDNDDDKNATDKKKESDSESDNESVKSDHDGRRSSASSSENDSSDEEKNKEDVKKGEKENDLEDGKHVEHEVENDDVKNENDIVKEDELTDKIEHMNLEDEDVHDNDEEEIEQKNENEKETNDEGREDEDHDEKVYEEEMVASIPSVVSRESTMLTGNEDGRCDSENKTIQFNEEVDVVHYEKVDVESSANDGDGVSSDEGSDADDDDFDGALNNGRERVVLADLGLDDEDLEVESDDIVIDSDGEVKEVHKNKEVDST